MHCGKSSFPGWSIWSFLEIRPITKLLLFYSSISVLLINIRPFKFHFLFVCRTKCVTVSRFANPRSLSPFLNQYAGGWLYIHFIICLCRQKVSRLLRHFGTVHRVRRLILRRRPPYSCQVVLSLAPHIRRTQFFFLLQKYICISGRINKALHIHCALMYSRHR